MGASTAYHLLRSEPGLSVTVVERDSTYARASTVLSDGNVRIQFSLEENILISKHAMEVLSTFDDDMETAAFRPEIAARRQGNLFLADHETKGEAMAGVELQRRLGCEVEWLEPEQLAERFPGLGIEGVAGGTFAGLDGSVDPSAVLRGYRNKAAELGATFLEDEVVAVLVEGGSVNGVRLERGEDVTCPMLVVTAGAWTADLVRPLGIGLPVIPVMRTVYVVSSKVSTAGMPSVFLPSGVYALPESEQTWLMAWSRPEDPIGYDFTPAGRQRFTDLIWPELHRHLPVFDRLEVDSSWAGLYAVNILDGNAIVGQWPGMDGLYLATGFSGHGFQQGPALGRYLSELILDLEPIIDLSRLGPQRVIDNQPLHEHAGRLI